MSKTVTDLFNAIITQTINGEIRWENNGEIGVKKLYVSKITTGLIGLEIVTGLMAWFRSFAITQACLTISDSTNNYAVPITYWQAAWLRYHIEKNIIEQKFEPLKTIPIVNSSNCRSWQPPKNGGYSANAMPAVTFK